MRLIPILAALISAIQVQAATVTVDSAQTVPSALQRSNQNLKVYVMVGFHVDFYHSWRGDQPDETGYGYDHRIISSSIRKLNEANKKGLKAKAYWDFAASHWTFGEFLPKNFPDLVPAWQSRDNNDEFIVGPYNNGANSAATKTEFTKAIDWTLRNPGGYGLKQMFKNVSPFYRPQEMFFASGQVQWLKDAGMKGVILQYASFAFNAFSNFVAPLKTEDRFNPILFRTHEAEEPIILLPSLSPIDLVNFNSLESLLISLRKKQLSGEINRNLVVHINMDADALSWEPMANKTIQGLVPNLGGLNEIIAVVNKFSWSDFTTPSEYLRIEKPMTTIMVRQDMADGAFDGMASWAEKESTQKAWTRIEQSRSLERILDFNFPDFAKRDLWSDKGFFNRLLSLSTTHFGMAVPVVHFERLKRLETYVGDSLKSFTEKLLTLVVQKGHEPNVTTFDFPRFGQTSLPQRAMTRRNSILVPKDVKNPTGLFSREPYDSKYDRLDLFQQGQSKPATQISLINPKSVDCSAGDLHDFNDELLNVEFDRASGVHAISFKGQTFGGDDFLSPFVSFKSGKALNAKHARTNHPEIVTPDSYQIATRVCKSAPELRTVTLSTELQIEAHEKSLALPIEYKFWRMKGEPHLFMDVHAEIPYTIDETAPLEASRQFMQHVDWRWEEIALSQLRPKLGDSTRLRVWKMNYEGLVTSFDVEQDKFNPKNANLSSMNNQVTPGWMAVSNGKRGVLIAFNTARRASFGAVPMRVTTDADGLKTVALNPFGSYYGRQLDYSHLGGERLGSVLANIAAEYIKPNGPSFVGKTIDYELMITGFEGDRPSEALIQDALTFAYPSAAVVSIPSHQILETSFAQFNRERIQPRLDKTLRPPQNLAAASMRASIACSWVPSPSQLDKYQILWRAEDATTWATATVSPTTSQFTISGLTNGVQYDVAIRSLQHGSASALSNLQRVTPSQTLKSAIYGSIAPNLNLLYRALQVIIDKQTLRDPDPSSPEGHP